MMSNQHNITINMNPTKGLKITRFILLAIFIPTFALHFIFINNTLIWHILSPLLWFLVCIYFYFYYRVSKCKKQKYKIQTIDITIFCFLIFPFIIYPVGVILHLLRLI